MKQSVIKELLESDLIDRIVEHRELLSKMKMNHAVSPLENPMKIKRTRRTIARLLTESHKREIQQGTNE